MIEQVHPPDAVDDAGIKKGIGSIGIRLGAHGRFGDPAVLYQLSVLCEIAFTPFEPIEKRRGHSMLSGLFGIHAPGWAYLTKLEPPALDAMIDGKAADLELR